MALLELNRIVYCKGRLVNDFDVIWIDETLVTEDIALELIAYLEFVNKVTIK